MRKLRMTICVLLWNCFLLNIRADEDADESSDVYVRVNPCRPAGEDSGEYAELLLKPDSKKNYYIGLPSGLSPGSYRCEWRLILRDTVTKNSTAAKPYSGFATNFQPYYRFPSYLDPNYVYSIGEVSVSVSEAEYSLEKFPLETFMNSKTVKTPNNTVIVLEATIGENKKYTKYLFFARIAVSSEVVLFPKRFKVTEILGKAKFIRNHRFTWIQARRFCKSKGLDLCPRYHENVCAYRTPFFHGQPNISTQYFPALPYNSWVTVTNITDGSCNDDIAGPPQWGTRGALCPVESCKSKSYIYCCADEKFRTKYAPEFVHVTSERDMDGEVLYRYSEQPDYEYDSHMNRWNLLWESAGRIPGDIRRFTMSSSYSKRTPTAIYFCTITVSPVSLRRVETYRYMIDIKPCQHPWKYRYYGYVSKKPRKGFRTIYIGQSKRGYGSRVSIEPWCCGYEENSFLIYAEVSKDWIYEMHPELCGPFQLAEANSNITKFESSDLALANPPLYCTWRINASIGEGIHIEYKLSGIGQDEYNHEYLRFKNTESGRVYSQSKAGSFISSGNSVEIDLATEEAVPSFYINYRAVNKKSPVPIGYKVESENATWSKAWSLCQNESLELCSLKDICPAGDYPYGGFRDSLIPVSDRHEEWAMARYPEHWYEERLCDLLSRTEGPADWSVKNRTFPDRSWVYCCDTETIPWPYWKPVRVYIGTNTRNEVHWFNTMDEWISPLYRHNYIDPYHLRLHKVYPWKPPSLINGSDFNVVDYFISSNRFVRNVFDQVVYFCTERYSDVPFESEVKASLTKCQYPWSYKFHVYAGSIKRKEAPVLLTFGNVTTADDDDHPACCVNNPDSFEVYVVETGMVESDRYETEGNETDYFDDYNYEHYY